LTGLNSFSVGAAKAASLAVEGCSSGSVLAATPVSTSNGGDDDTVAAAKDDSVNAEDDGDEIDGTDDDVGAVDDAGNPPLNGLLLVLLLIPIQLLLLLLLLPLWDSGPDGGASTADEPSAIAAMRSWCSFDFMCRGK
jgi:hypothetical protein